MAQRWQSSRRPFLLVTGTVLGLVGIFVLLVVQPWPGKQKVQGRSLNEWLEQLWTTNRPQAQLAIQEMGTNIVPILRRKLEWEHSLWRRWYRANWPALPGWVQKRLTAPPATEDVQEPIRRALLALGPAVLPCVSQWLHHPDVDILSVAIDVIQELGPASGSAIPELVRLLSDPDEGKRNRAVYALATVGNRTNGAVPVLAQIAGGQIRVAEEMRGTAAWAIGRMRADRSLVVPSLEAVLESTNCFARAQAAVALWRIDPGEPRLDRLLVELEQAPSTSICVDILEGLKDSKPAVGRVLDRLDSPDWSGKFRREILDILRKLAPKRQPNAPPQ